MEKSNMQIYGQTTGTTRNSSPLAFRRTSGECTNPLHAMFKPQNNKKTGAKELK